MMTEKMYRFSALTLQIVITISLSIMSFFVVRYVVQGDKSDELNSLEHKELLEGQRKILDLISDDRADIKALNEWKESMKTWKQLVNENMLKHNTRGGNTSTIKDEINSYSVYKDSASFANDY